MDSFVQFSLCSMYRRSSRVDIFHEAENAVRLFFPYLWPRSSEHPPSLGVEPMQGSLSLFASLNTPFLKADGAFQVLTRLPFSPPGIGAMEHSSEFRRSIGHASR